MSVTSHESIIEPLQVDGRRYISHFFTFHTGDVVQHGPKLVPGDFNTDADRAALVPVIEALVIDSEDNDLIAQVEDGDLTDVVNHTPTHPETDTEAARRKRWHRKLVRYAYRHREIKLVRRMLYALWYYLKFDSGYTPSQIATYFGVTVAKLAAFDARMQAIHDNLAFVDGDVEGEMD